eukprot:1379025-Prymnesium_polylepis.1
MPRVSHNTLGCHPFLHTEAHEITTCHLSAAQLTRTLAELWPEHEASRRFGLTFPVLMRHPDKRTCLPKSSTRLRYNCVISHVITSSSLPSLSPLR